MKLFFIYYDLYFLKYTIFFKFYNGIYLKYVKKRQLNAWKN